MHIPAVDSLRHERVGLMTPQDADLSMVAKVYVETESTEERGANDPIEGMSRPFPYMVRAEEAAVIEPVIESEKLVPLSDSLVEYAALLCESVQEGEWVDGVEEFEMDTLGEEEQELAESLLGYAGRSQPQTLWRTVYEKSSELANQSDEKSVDLFENPLRDIVGRDRYGFAYLPAINDVDEWELLLATVDKETEAGDKFVAEQLWLRYEKGDVAEERPLVVYQNETVQFAALSPSVDFSDSEMEAASESLVEAILAKEEDTEFQMASVPREDIAGTRTEAYLEEFLE